MAPHRRPAQSPDRGLQRANVRFREDDGGSDADDDEEKQIYSPLDRASFDFYSNQSAIHHHEDSPPSPSAESHLMSSFSRSNLHGKSKTHRPRSSRQKDQSSGLGSSSVPSNLRFRTAAAKLVQYWPNRRFTRIIGFSLIGIVALFIAFLIRESFVSARQAEIGWGDKAHQPKVWESFAPLEGYYRGVQAIISKTENIPENAGKVVFKEGAGLDRASTVKHANPLMDIPTSNLAIASPQPFAPFPEYDSATYVSANGPSKTCFLDEKGAIPVPDILAYPGVPAGMPNPLTGSYDVLGIRDDVCFDRTGRLGPYGLQEVSSTNENNKIDWSSIRWADAQERCFKANKARFEPSGKNETATPRSVVLLRTWLGYEYTPEDIVHIRALISELSLKSRGEYTVHFLIHVKDHAIPIWGDEATYQSVLKSALPDEFFGMGSLWSEHQMSLIYSGVTDSMFRGLPVHGAYRSTFMPVQYFSKQHPEFDYIWHWEMDARYTGHFYHLFDQVTSWATKQPRRELWERNSRYYIPAVHGTWADFRHTVRVQSENGVPDPSARLRAGFGKSDVVDQSPDKPVWGPVRPAEKDRFETESDPTPPSEKPRDDDYSWGVGEQADLITFNPIFDPAHTDWILSDDVSGYHEGVPPRRSAIITTSRLSRRLLQTMHRESVLARHTMFSEMWPSSCALHHGLKAVYAPHPLYFDRSWPADYASQTLNAGKGGSTGGSRASVFSEDRQHNLQGSTWYYQSRFGPRMWRRWLGLPAFGIGAGADQDVVQKFDDARVDLVRLDEEGPSAIVVPTDLKDLVEKARGGGEMWERSPVAGGRGGDGDAKKVVVGGTGRMCLPAMLLHPVKKVTGLVVLPVVEEEAKAKAGN